MLTSLNLKAMAHDTVRRYTSVNPVTITRYMNDSLRVLLDVFNNSETRNKSDPRPSEGNVRQRRETGTGNPCNMRAG